MTAATPAALSATRVGIRPAPHSSDRSTLASTLGSSPASYLTARFHSFSVLSLDTVTALVLQGENSTQCTADLCPLRVIAARLESTPIGAPCLERSTSQTFTSAVNVDTAMRLPSGEMAALWFLNWRVSMRPISTPESTAQTRTLVWSDEHTTTGGIRVGAPPTPRPSPPPPHDREIAVSPSIARFFSQRTSGGLPAASEMAKRTRRVSPIPDVPMATKPSVAAGSSSAATLAKHAPVAISRPRGTRKVLGALHVAPAESNLKTLTVASSHAVTTVVPLPLKATMFTASVCPFSVLTCSGWFFSAA